MQAEPSMLFQDTQVVGAHSATHTARHRYPSGEICLYQEKEWQTLPPVFEEA